MIKNKNGFTLVEVLAAFTILSIILLLLSSVHLLGIQVFNDQSSQVNNQANVQLAMDKIVKEIRSVSLNDIQISNGVLTINHSDVYKLENDTITRNGSAIAYHIKQFNIINDGDKIIIKIQSVSNHSGQSITLSTDVYIRR